MPETRGPLAIISTETEGVLYPTGDAVTHEVTCWEITGSLLLLEPGGDTPRRTLPFIARNLAGAILASGVDSAEAERLRELDPGTAALNLVRKPDRSLQSLLVTFVTEHLSLDALPDLLHLALRRADDPDADGLEILWPTPTVARYGATLFQYRLQQVQALHAQSAESFFWEVNQSELFWRSDLLPAYHNAAERAILDLPWPSPGAHPINRAIDERVARGGGAGPIRSETVSEALFGPGLARKRKRIRSYLAVR